MQDPHVSSAIIDKRRPFWLVYFRKIKAEFSIVTRASSKAWISELIAAAGSRLTG
jgi:hypothetical protein